MKTLKLFALLNLFSLTNAFAQDLIQDNYVCTSDGMQVTITVRLNKEGPGQVVGRGEIEGFDSNGNSVVSLNLRATGMNFQKVDGMLTNEHYWFVRGTGDIAAEIISYVNPDKIEGRLLDKPMKCSKVKG